MKHLYNRSQNLNVRFIFHEVGSDSHIDSIAETIRTRAETAELSDQEIHDLAHRFAELVTNNEAFAQAFDEALGETLDPTEMNYWIFRLQAQLDTNLTESHRAQVNRLLPLLANRNASEEPTDAELPPEINSDDLLSASRGYLTVLEDNVELGFGESVEALIEQIESGALSLTDITVQGGRYRSVEEALNQAVEAGTITAEVRDERLNLLRGQLESGEYNADIILADLELEDDTQTRIQEVMDPSLVSTPDTEPSDIETAIERHLFNEAWEDVLDHEHWENVNFETWGEAEMSRIQQSIFDLAEGQIEATDKDEETLQNEIQRFIDRQLGYEAVNRLSRTGMDGTLYTPEELAAFPENERPQTITEALRTEFLSNEDLNDQDPALTEIGISALTEAAARRIGQFGVDENGAPIALENDDISQFIEGFMRSGEVDLDSTPSDDENPFARAIATYANNTAPGSTSSNEVTQIRTLGDLIRWFLDFISDDDEDDTVPTDEWGNPLPNAVPRGNTAAAESSPENHEAETSLNSEFYGEEMVSQFRETVSESAQQAVAEITSSSSWGRGDIMNDAPEDISGWKLAVMRNAVTRERLGQPALSAQQPFFANDLALQRAIIYIPNEAPILTTCYAGSGRNGGGGISNVENSYGSPLGSFYFQPSDVVHHGNSHRYRSQATVHGMEPGDPPRQYRVQRGEGANIDPGSGNTNTAGRAVLMHGSTGTTWGCWGIPPANAEVFARAIQQYGGASGEAFMSIQ